MKEIFLSLKNSPKGKVVENEMMKEKTSFRIGGKAAIFAEPESVEEVSRTLETAKNFNVKPFILGGATNVVLPDKDVWNTLVISSRSIKKIKIQEAKVEREIFVECEAGALMSEFVEFAAKNALWGAECFCGLPGSVGGAAFMNARCFGKEISEIFHSAKVFDRDEMKIKIVNFSQNEWSYKRSPFNSSKSLFILSVTFLLLQGKNSEKDAIYEKGAFYKEERKKRGHFLFPSAGSVFKNNRAFGKPSGQIIEEAGLKGISIGDAQIAPFHANFIINKGSATHDEVSELVKFTAKTVKEKYGFTLEREIIIVGEEND